MAGKRKRERKRADRFPSAFLCEEFRQCTITFLTTFILYFALTKVSHDDDLFKKRFFNIKGFRNRSTFDRVAKEFSSSTSPFGLCVWAIRTLGLNSLQWAKQRWQERASLEKGPRWLRPNEASSAIEAKQRKRREEEESLAKASLHTFL